MDEHELAQRVRNISDEIGVANDTDDAELREAQEYLDRAASILESRGSSLLT